jgi:hypothetical protein
VNRARATQADAATIFGAKQTKPIAQRPEQRHVGVAVDPMHASVDCQGEQRHADLTNVAPSQFCPAGTLVTIFVT